MTPMRVINLALLLAVPVAAQWLNLPTPGVPRTRDGKPDLTASAPKAPGGKPDFHHSDGFALVLDEVRN